jgi:intracellular multiplication protein IcmE
MSNNDDNDNDLDLDMDDLDNSAGFDDFSNKGTLGDLWRNNPMVKVGVILAAFVVIVGGVILFGGKSEDLPTSRLTGTSDLTEAPGTAEVSESYRQAIEEENTRTAEQALRENESAIPMPVEPPKGTIPLQEDDPEAEDPLDRWRRMQEERIQQQQIVNQAPTEPEPEAPPVDTKTPAVNAMAQAMSMQMESVLSNQQLKSPHFMPVTNMTYLEGLQEKERAAREAALAQQQLIDGQAGNDQIENIIIPAGTIEYAQLITEANTDAPGPVMAQIASGPLAGSRLIGTFQATENYITLQFNTAVIDGVSEAANAVAIDPNTTLPGMVTEIDRRYLKRIILPAAAAFVEGLGSAIANSGTTTLYIGDDTAAVEESDKGSREEVATGFEEAGDELGQLLEDEADATQPMLRIAAGTPIGVLFITPVIEGDDLEEQNQREEKRMIQLQQFQNLQQPYIPAFPMTDTSTGTTTTSGQ